MLTLASVHSPVKCRAAAGIDDCQYHFVTALLIDTTSGLLWQSLLVEWTPLMSHTNAIAEAPSIMHEGRGYFDVRPYLGLSSLRIESLMLYSLAFQHLYACA